MVVERYITSTGTRVRNIRFKLFAVRIETINRLLFHKRKREHHQINIKEALRERIPHIRSCSNL